jgi:hypothetical protein
MGKRLRKEFLEITAGVVQAARLLFFQASGLTP